MLISPLNIVLSLTIDIILYILAKLVKPVYPYTNAEPKNIKAEAKPPNKNI